MPARAGRSAALAGGLALTGTVAVATVPFLRFTYVSSASRVAMEMAQASIAALVAYLLYGRFRRSGRGSDLLLAFALGVSAAGNLLNVVIRAVTEDHTSLSPFGTWSGRTIGLVAAATFTAAAWSPERLAPRPAHRGRSTLAAIGATVAATCSIVWALDSWLPDSTKRIAGDVGSARPTLETDGLVVAVNVTLLALFAAAAAGMLRRATRDRSDELFAWLGVGLVLATVARFNFVLYPSLYTDVVHTGDVLRLAFYLVLLVGAEREIRSYWRARAQVAVLDERRRIARELHDGVTQELSFIRSQMSAFARGRGDPAMAELISSAAERALAESRRAITALSDRSDEALDGIVRGAVAEVADRAGLTVTYELAPGIDVGAATDDVARIAREATTNASKHGSASVLRVTLAEHAGGIRLTVADDGSGFDETTSPQGFGLQSMRQRAEQLGGTLTVSSGDGGGTRVTLQLPRSGAVPAEPL